MSRLPTKGRWVAAALALWTSGADAATRMPLPDGNYCGPGGAVVGLDGQAGTVAIDGYTCGFPVFAASKLQSLQCRQGDGPPQRREFDVRVLSGAMLYNGQWFRPCKS